MAESGARPAFTLHTLQPLRDMRHLEQPSFAAVHPLRAAAPSCAASRGERLLLIVSAPCSCRHVVDHAVHLPSDMLHALQAMHKIQQWQCPRQSPANAACGCG